MLCYILARYALFVYKNILLFFDIKKQSHRNCCRILNINLVIGICKFISSKLWILPTPTRHLQIHIQQVADASTSGIHPLYVSTNPIPTSCRCFRPRPGICKFNTSKLQILPTPGYVSTSPIPANCRYFRPRPGICKSNTSKLWMLPTLTRHLQVQYQQVADTSEPGQASASPIPASCRYFHVRNSPLYVSTSPIPASCGCFRP